MDITAWFLDVHLRPGLKIFDVLGTYCGRKYGRLDVIQHPAYQQRDTLWNSSSNATALLNTNRNFNPNPHPHTLAFRMDHYLHSTGWLIE